MDQEAILKKLLKHQTELTSRYEVASLSLFGSTARGESTAKSDIDILVTYKNTPGILGFLELKVYLEDLFQCHVDLVTKNALKKQLRTKILQEAIHAF